MVAQLHKEGILIPPELEDQITDPEAESESQHESASESGSGCGSDEVIISYNSWLMHCYI